MEITRKQFLQYERVRQSGKWNMVTDATQALRETGLTLEQYVCIIRNYRELLEQYADIPSVAFSLNQSEPSRI